LCHKRRLGGVVKVNRCTLCKRGVWAKQQDGHGVSLVIHHLDGGVNHQQDVKLGLSVTPAGFFDLATVSSNTAPG
jgi:hypothetical protein